MKSRIIGILVFAAIAIVAIVIISGNLGKKVITITGYVGGEKIGLLEDVEVQKILKSDYGIVVDYTKAGSIEMAREDVTGIDFLFPSSQIAVEIFKNEQGKIAQSEKVFNSPIVLYSWKPVVDAFIKDGIVELRDNTYYFVNFPKLVEYVQQDKKWSDLGLDLYGNIKIISTDPNKSNSGNMYLGLLANMLNDGNVVDESTLMEVAPKAYDVFAKLGYMESSSSNMFERYLTLGMGDSPVIVGYENQLIEFALENKALWEKVKDQVITLYPEPTVWSEHTVIALNDQGKKLIEALSDEKVQKIAWEKHGFRTGLVSIENDATVLNIIGIPESITKVIPLPSAKVMELLMKEIEQK